MNLDKLVRSARLVLTAAVLVAGGWYAYAHGSELTILREVGLASFLLVAAVLAAVFIATGLTFFLLVGAVGVRMDVVEWIGLTFVSNALNYLIPVRPGVIAKATYLKSKAALAYSRFSSVLVANAVLFIGTTASLGFAVLVWMRPGGRSAMVVAALCAALIALSTVPLYVPLFRFRRDGRIFDLLNNAVQGFEEIRSKRFRIVLIGLSIVLQHLLSAVACLAAFHALGFQISFPISLSLVAFASIANVLAITPNNIGVQELVMAYAYSLGGLDFHQGLLGAALIRAAHIVLTFAIAPAFIFRLLTAGRLRLAQLVSSNGRVLGRTGPTSRREGEP